MAPTEVTEEDVDPELKMPSLREVMAPVDVTTAAPELAIFQMPRFEFDEMAPIDVTAEVDPALAMPSSPAVMAPVDVTTAAPEPA